MARLKDDAIVLRRWDWSETSQTVSLFCRTLGVVRGLAKGAKRERGAFCGGFEPLTVGGVEAIDRAGGALATLTEWDLREVYACLRRDLRAHFAGLFLADAVHHALAERDPHPGLWDRLVGALRAMERGETPDVWVVRVLWEILSETGHRPDLGDNGDAPAVDGAYAFSPRRGRLAPGVGGGGESWGESGQESGGDSWGEVWRVRARTVELLRSLGADPAAEHEPETVQRAGRFLASYLVWVTGRRPPAMALYLGTEGGVR